MPRTLPRVSEETRDQSTARYRHLSRDVAVVAVSVAVLQRRLEHDGRASCQAIGQGSCRSQIELRYGAETFPNREHLEGHPAMSLLPLDGVPMLVSLDSWRIQKASRCRDFPGLVVRLEACKSRKSPARERAVAGDLGRLELGSPSARCAVGRSHPTSQRQGSARRTSPSRSR